MPLFHALYLYVLPQGGKREHAAFVQAEIVFPPVIGAQQIGGNGKQYAGLVIILDMNDMIEQAVLDAISAGLRCLILGLECNHGARTQANENQ